MPINNADHLSNSKAIFLSLFEVILMFLDIALDIQAEMRAFTCQLKAFFFGWRSMNIEQLLSPLDPIIG